MTLMETIARLVSEGYTLKRNKRGNVDFPVPKEIYKKYVSDIEFPKRIENYSLRNDVHTIDTLIDVFNAGDKLKGIGKETIKDAKVNILEVIWESLDEVGRVKYLQEVFV